MIVRLQQHIAAGRLDPAAIHIYFVEPTISGKKLRKLTLDSKGIFTTPWPGGFFPERLEEAKQLAITRAQSTQKQNSKKE